MESAGSSMRLQSTYKNNTKIRDLFLILCPHSHVGRFSARTPTDTMLFVLDKSGKILVASTAVDYPDLNAQETSNTFYDIYLA